MCIRDRIIDQVVLFLEGNTTQIVGSLKSRMNESAENLEFEKAAALRDQLISIEKVQEGQKVLTLKPENLDVVACSQWSDDAWIEIFFIRQGKLIGRDSYLMEVGQHDDITSVQNAFLQQFYEVTPYVPPNVLVQMPIGEEEKIVRGLGPLPALLLWFSGTRPTSARRRHRRSSYFAGQ